MHNPVEMTQDVIAEVELEIDRLRDSYLDSLDGDIRIHSERTKGYVMAIKDVLELLSTM